MVLAVQLPQAFARHMGVDLRRGQVGVPQKELHRAKVCTMVEQVRRERVAQGMRPHPLGQAERLGVPFLGEVPLEMAIRETSDAGLPIVASQPDSPHAAAYRAIAENVRNAMAGGGSSKPAPRIVIEA